jgi:hypothetical protein
VVDEQEPPASTDPSLGQDGDGCLLIVGGRLRTRAEMDSETLRRVTETLGHLIQVKNLIVLLGSGASHHLGSPDD